MKIPHLLRVDREVSQFSDLIDATRESGMRVGWLDLENANPAPQPLEDAAVLGVLRAVSVGAGRVLSVKPVRGLPILKDLLREHFRGCELVLVLGRVDVPVLDRVDGGWRVQSSKGERFKGSTAQLVSRLRRSRSFGANDAVEPKSTE